MFFRAKFLQDVSVLHWMIRASVCFRLGRPSSYQHGYIRSLSAKAALQNWEQNEPTSVTHDPSPGLKVLTVPAKFSHVKFSILTEELLGRSAPLLFWSKYVCVTKMGKVTL